MGLLDVDKIIIKRTIVGIRCPACEGNLTDTQKKSFIGLAVQLISLGKIKPKNYQCESCKRKTVLLF